MTASAAIENLLFLPLSGRPVPGSSRLGGKAHKLALLSAAGESVPPWFSLTVDAFQELVWPSHPLPQSPEEARVWQEHVRSDLRLPPEFLRSLRKALREAGLEGKLLAVRSSAAGEDGERSSFAGQFDTQLGVTGDRLEAAIRQVWSSAGNPHALLYGKGLIPMGVVIQAMVDPEVSGVAFGADPVSGSRSTILISSVYGLGEALVSGEMDADTYRVEFEREEEEITSLHRELALKPLALRLAPGGGTFRVALPPEQQEASSLEPGEERRVALAVRRLNRLFGAPQDVEWSLSSSSSQERHLHILQSRPITTLPAPPGELAEEERRVWDNSNIVESYAGVTSPLTFSFACSVYEDVYLQFCTLVGVPSRNIARNRLAFAQLLGQIRGRVYYNLLNWYRVLALLPGFTVNRSFMERMMGVRESLPDVLSEKGQGKAADAGRLARMLFRLARESRRLQHEVPRFHAHVDQVLLPLWEEDLKSWSADRLVRLYHRLEEELLGHWQTPIVNDFFAMIWFGVLSKLVEKWLPGAPATLVNDLLTHEGGIISTEPARAVMRLAQQVSSHPELAREFDSPCSEQELWESIQEREEHREFHQEVSTYLKRFGDRCMNELKLETITLSEDPSFLLQMIRSYRRSGMKPVDASHESRLRLQAEALIKSTLSPLRYRLFRTALKNARARVRDRENLRFERTRVFGTVRRIFLGLGHQFTRSGVLAAERDIFYLRLEEVLGHVEGTGTLQNLQGLVALRREEWQRFEKEPSPPERFESFGPPLAGRWKHTRKEQDNTLASAALRGIGCCPGIIRAPVRVVHNPREAGDLSGCILVAERTDPGWTLLFPAAEGLLVERGSLLSHSAIVAREVGLPCIVSIRGLMDNLRDGEWVEMDGTTGEVRRIADG